MGDVFKREELNDDQRVLTKDEYTERITEIFGHYEEPVRMSPTELEYDQLISQTLQWAW